MAKHKAATEITIAGNVDGDVRTDGKIEVASTARVRGSLIGRMISVAEGAVIEGEMQMTGSSDPGVVKLAEKVNT